MNGHMILFRSALAGSGKGAGRRRAAATPGMAGTVLAALALAIAAAPMLSLLG
ncbi:MAG: hypothetical protein HXY25_13190 [Alphaproteobacteria bacterium]|nr:hypothetical protein [Alphaproteobacteria bacterium]